MSRKIKSSSGDTSNTNPYMRKWIGTEVLTSKIDRTRNVVKIYTKVL